MKKALEGFRPGDRVTVRPGPADVMLKRSIGTVVGFLGDRLKIAFGTMIFFRAPEQVVRWPGNSAGSAPHGDGR